MEDPNYRRLEALIIELINALEEELELENPFIPEDVKNLLIRYMVQDIFQRKGSKSQFDFSRMSSFVMEKSLEGITQEGNDTILH